MCSVICLTFIELSIIWFIYLFKGLFYKKCYSENYFLPKLHKGCIPLYFVTKHVIHRSYLKTFRRWYVDVYGNCINTGSGD